MKRTLAFVLLISACAWAQSPIDGTWKINLNNAQFSQKPETFAIDKGTYTCSTCVEKISIKADGTDQKVPGAKSYDTLAVKTVDDKTVQMTRKKGGKVVGEETDTVGADGKSMTIKFKDYPPQGDPVTGTVMVSRAAAGPAGSHAVSGSWKTQKVDVSDRGLTVTFKSSKDGLMMSAPTGESYDAKFDGKDYPVKADRAGGTVSLKKVNDNTIEETYKQDGKPVAINTMTVTGDTMKYVAKDVRRGTTDSFTATKQK